MFNFKKIITMFSSMILSTPQESAQTNHYEEALKELDKAIKLQPNEPGYYHAKALALKFTDRMDEALKRKFRIRAKNGLLTFC